MVGLHNLYWYYGSQTYYDKTDGVDKLRHTSEAFQGYVHCLCFTSPFLRRIFTHPRYSYFKKVQ